MGQVWVENRLNFSSIEAFFNFIFGFESLHPHHIVATKKIFARKSPISSGFFRV